MQLDFIFKDAVERFSLTAFVKGLRQEGYDFINHASNTFANCFTQPNDEDVVIINTDPDCAPAFYTLCKEAAASNPFLPQVLDIRSFGERATAVRMERLIALDHIDLNEDDKALLEQSASELVSYLRGEENSLEETEDLRSAAVQILTLSQEVYSATGGRVLPFCDLKPDNVFLRKTVEGTQFVFGDPLFPGSGGNADNVSKMNATYQKFGLPSLAMA